MKINSKVTAAFVTFLLSATGFGVISAHAQSGSTLIGRSQFRRVVDPSERSAVGTLLLRKKSNEQIIIAYLKGYTQESQAMYFAPDPTPPFQAQNYPNYFLYDI